MRLTDNDLDEFAEIYKAEFKKDISREEARDVASQLMKLYELLARPLPSEKLGSGRVNDSSEVPERSK